MRLFLLIGFVLFSLPGFAETIETDAYTVEIPDDWHMERVDRDTSRIALYPPESKSRLQIAARTFDDTPIISQEWLKDFATRDTEREMAWETWGELGGYSQQYTVRLQERRSWWLTDGHLVLMSTWSTGFEEHIEPYQDAVETIIRSVHLR